MSLIKIAGTGHRKRDCEDEQGVRIRARLALTSVRTDVFLMGLCDGFDLWAADEARILGIDVWCGKPWAGHKALEEDMELYATIEAYASKVHIIDPSQSYPGPHVYHQRNQWLVDNATHVLCYLNPVKTSGGTFECVKYAKGKKPVRNVWNEPPF